MANATKTYLGSSDTSTNYSFSSADIDFNSGDPTLKFIAPTALTFFSNYNNGIDAAYAPGGATGTANTTTVDTTNGTLDLTGSDLKFVSYATEGNAQGVARGAIRFKITPDYSGTPAATKAFFSIYGDNDSYNLIRMYHNNSGQIGIVMRDSSGTNIRAGNFGPWSPASGTSYEWELNWNVNTGTAEIRAFQNGTQFFNTLNTSSALRTDSVTTFRVGTDNLGTVPDFFIDEFAYFTEEQHTVDYSITTLKLYTTSVTTIIPVTSLLNVSEVSDASFTATVPTGSSLQYTVQLDGNEKWWNGSSWSCSDTTTARNNYDETITTANWQSLISASRSTVNFKFYFGSSSGAFKPILNDFSVVYDSIDMASVTGVFLNPDNTIPASATVAAWPKDFTNISSEGIQVNTLHTVTSSVDASTGAWSMDLFSGVTYQFKFLVSSGTSGLVDKTINTTGSVVF